MGYLSRWRAWLPIPTREGGFDIVGWILIEGNRFAVTVALLLVTFVSLLGLGTLWTFEMQQLLTETEAVQTLLNTLLGGIILLVSIVVSINSIVLSYQITSLSGQREQIDAALNFRRELGRLTDAEGSPTDPASFMETMAKVIRQHAQRVLEGTEDIDEELIEILTVYTEGVVERTQHLEEAIDRTGGGQFGVLWMSLETDYSGQLDQSHVLITSHSEEFSERTIENLEDLITAFELYATGREYFKTLYYNEEISNLSRRLLIISLPAILITASTILAINARLLPDMWVFGLSPLLTFVAATFTIALSPFVVLTSHMLRLTTISMGAVVVGPLAIRR